MKKVFISALIVILVGCASTRSTTSSGPGTGNTRTKPVESIDDRTYLLTWATADPTYAFTKGNPVKVGGITTGGPGNERRFLNALLGPNKEAVGYRRAGSCCPFKTPNGFIENSGLLDQYFVYWEGSRDTVSMYINMYDEGDLFIPVGFGAKSKN